MDGTFAQRLAQRLALAPQLLEVELKLSALKDVTVAATRLARAGGDARCSERERERESKTTT